MENKLPLQPEATTPTKQVPRYRYDAGDGRWKHKKHQDRNTFKFFLNHDGALVGQCPYCFKDDPELAEQLLNAAISWTNPRDQRPGPHALFCIHDGVVYKALPTEPSRSFHGFPIKEADLTKKNIPPTVKEQILDVARKQGDLGRIEAWLDQKP